MKEPETYSSKDFKNSQNVYGHLNFILNYYQSLSTNPNYWQALIKQLEKEDRSLVLTQVLNSIGNYCLGDKVKAFEILAEVIDMKDEQDKPIGINFLWKNPRVIDLFMDIDELKEYFMDNDKITFILAKIFSYR